MRNSFVIMLALALIASSLTACQDAGDSNLLLEPQFIDPLTGGGDYGIGEPEAEGDYGLGGPDFDTVPEGEGEEPQAEEPPPAAEPPADASKLSGTQKPGVRPDIIEDYRSAFVHGPKGPEYQKYIVLHDTEGWNSPQSVISGWANSGAGVAAHFIVGVDGTIYQCVPMDNIAHHSGYGNAGHNAAFGVTDESRDDRIGTTWVGSAFPDYGMNSYSIGIEMVHVGDGSPYPLAQLEALDSLISYIDAYYGFESSIIDHKTWCTPNSDTSREFSGYLYNYQHYRSYQAP